MCSSIRNWNYSLNKEKSWNRQALPVQPVLLPLYEFFLIKTTKWQLDTSHVCSLVSPFIISLQSLAARMIFLSHFPHNAFLPPCFSSFLIFFWYKLVLVRSYLVQKFSLIPFPLALSRLSIRAYFFLSSLLGLLSLWPSAWIVCPLANMKPFISLKNKH